MARIFYFSLLISFQFSFSLYGQSTSAPSPTNFMKLRIDPATATTVNANDIYQKIEYIPLEANTQSMIGSISRMEVADDRIVVYDMDTKNTLFFKSDGSFVSKLTPRQVGNHAGLSSAVPEGNVYNSFTLINKDGENYVLIRSNKLFIYYNLDGVFLRAEKELKPTALLTFSDGTELHNYYTDKDKSIYAYALIKDTEIRKYHIFSEEHLMTDELYTQGSGFYPSRDKNSILYLDYYSYDVHETNAEGSELKYQFIFPSSHSLPPSFMFDSKYKGKKYDYFIENKQAIYGVHNVVEAGDYLYFSLASWTTSSSEKKNLALHKPSGKLISLQHIIPDESTYFLPTNDAHYGGYFMRKGFMTYDSKYFYTLISPVSMAKFDADNKERKETYPENLAKSISKGANANPIVVKITPKLK